MFFGRYDYTIDAKGRLNFPAKFRDAMGESFVVLEWVDNCLFVLPLPEVEKLAEKLEADELMDSWEVSGDLFREYFSSNTKIAGVYNFHKKVIKNLLTNR